MVPSAPWSSERRSVSFLTVFRMELKRPGVFFISAMDAALRQPCLLVTAHVGTHSSIDPLTVQSDGPRGPHLILQIERRPKLPSGGLDIIDLPHSAPDRHSM